MYFRKYRPLDYYIEAELLNVFAREHIPYNLLYSNDQSWGGRYGDGGVSFITLISFGLDFQAVVVCGVKPLGVYDKTKQLKREDILDEEQTENLKKNISYLYVACTRS